MTRRKVPTVERGERRRWKGAVIEVMHGTEYRGIPHHWIRTPNGGEGIVPDTRIARWPLVPARGVPELERAAREQGARERAACSCTSPALCAKLQGCAQAVHARVTGDEDLGPVTGDTSSHP